MLRLTHLAKQLSQSSASVAQDLTLRGSGRFFLRHIDCSAPPIVHINKQVVKTGVVRYAAFSKLAEVMLPLDMANDYAQRCHETTLPQRLAPELFPLRSCTTAATTSAAEEAKERDRERVVDRRVGVLLGHFNHGKTSLLEALLAATADPKLRFKPNLVSSEKHGITQEVRTKLIRLSESQEVTLVDTPGQDIFYRMRNLGAKVADFALLLIDVDDGFGPQTEESIGIIESLDVPVIVCLNKIDKLPQGLNDSKLQELLQQCKEYVVLDPPATSPNTARFLPLSATAGTNIPQLLDLLRDLFRSPSVSDAQQESAASIPPDHIAPKFLQGRGQVLNVYNDNRLGQVMHVLLTHGTLSTGSFFSASGWAGKVVSMLNDDNQQVQTASAGLAVRMKVSFAANSARGLRPLGSFIHFYAPQLPADASKRDREKLEDAARQEAEDESDQCAMREVWPHYALSADEIARFRVPALFEKSRTSRYYKDQDERIARGEIVLVEEDVESAESEEEATDEEDHSTSEQIVAHDDEEEELDESIDGEEEEDEGEEETDIPDEVYEKIEEFLRANQQKLLLKAQSDLDVGTIQDAYDDALEVFMQEAAQNMTALGAMQPPRRFVFTGVGVVSMHDVLIAKEAKAAIVTYNVGVEKTAMKDVQKFGMKVLNFDKIQDIIDLIKNNTPLPIKKKK